MRVKKFANIKSMVAWAYQVTDSIPIKVQRFADTVGGRSPTDLSPAEAQEMALDVMSKISRMPKDEQAVLTAYFTRTEQSISAACCALPDLMPEFAKFLVHGWCHDHGLPDSQKNIAAKLGTTQTTVSRNFIASCKRLDEVLRRALVALELQLMDEILILSPANRWRKPVNFQSVEKMSA